MTMPQPERTPPGPPLAAPAPAAFVTGLRDHLLRGLAPLVAGAPAIALLDFPAHANVGDSAIWLGALEALRVLEAPAPSYTCDSDHYDRRALARALGDAGIILFTGGGSFGDLWERPLRFRERVVGDFPRHRIVQLPESAHFVHAESLARARATFNRHDHVTLLARDAASLTLFQREFRAPSTLLPDMAFALGPLPRPGSATGDLLWLKRGDREDRWPGAVIPAATDWLIDEPDWLISLTGRLQQRLKSSPRLRPALARVLARAHAPVAQRRLARGVRLLASARTVVTDRLHGHILALLLGIPHVILDNSYGKLHQFAAAWTHASPLVHLAHSPPEADAIAQALLADLAAPRR